MIDEQVSQVCGSEAPLCRDPRPPDAQPRVGDRLADETGAWEVVGRPYTTAGGKTARVRVKRVGEPSNHHLRTWGAHERIGVKRATAEEDKR